VTCIVLSVVLTLLFGFLAAERPRGAAVLGRGVTMSIKSDRWIQADGASSTG